MDQGLAFGLREVPLTKAETGAGGGVDGGAGEVGGSGGGAGGGGGQVRGGGGGLAPVEAGGASPIPTLRKFPRAAVASDGRRHKQIIMSVFQHLLAVFVIVCG